MNWTFKFDLPNCEGLGSFKIVHWYSYQFYCLLCFLNSNCYEFHWCHRTLIWMYYIKQIFGGVVFTSLEPPFDLGVAHGVVCFPHRRSSLFLMHFVAVGVVSSSSSILSFSLSSMLGISAPPHCWLYCSLASSPYCKQV